jgi:predicted NAD-dependent protein-ADP-ribosyltransferase YbiA (DUF1768 family)
MIMDIGSKNSYPAGALSNFTANKFTIDGVECASMEGFLQALKFENQNSQIITCGLKGFDAKRKGSSRNKYWQSKQTLWWNGRSYPRKSKAYQLLLNKAYNRMYTDSEGFRKALQASGKAVLTHSIGKNKESETVLTENELCKRLMHLRDYGLLSEIEETDENEFI